MAVDDRLFTSRQRLGGDLFIATNHGDLQLLFRQACLHRLGILADVVTNLDYPLLPLGLELFLVQKVLDDRR